jgi:hypothetical protein
LEELLHIGAAEVALVVEVRHIDDSVHRRERHEEALHKEEVVHEHPGSPDMAIACATEVVEANGRHKGAVRGLTLGAAAVEDTPDFRGEHRSWDCRAPRRNWSSRPSWR